MPSAPVKPANCTMSVPETNACSPAPRSTTVFTEGSVSTRSHASVQTLVHRPGHGVARGDPVEGDDQRRALLRHRRSRHRGRALPLTAAATEDALVEDPSAVELMDRTILDLSRQKIEYAVLGEMLHDDPDALLFVSSTGDDLPPLRALLDRFTAAWARHGHGHHPAARRDPRPAGPRRSATWSPSSAARLLRARRRPHPLGVQPRTVRRRAVRGDVRRQGELRSRPRG